MNKFIGKNIIIYKAVFISFLYFRLFIYFDKNLECSNESKEPIIYDDLNEFLKNSSLLNKAFQGESPVIVKNLSEFCYPNFDNHVKRDEIYLEIFNSFNESNLIYKHFGKHVTLHNHYDYGKTYKNGYIFHKDQLPLWGKYILYNRYFSIPNLLYYLPRFIPKFTKNIDKSQKHIMCSCKDTREVFLSTPSCTDNILKDYDKLHDLTPPRPIYIKNTEKILSNIDKYEFILDEFDCLFFNPFRQFHIFKGTDRNIGQVHFFLGEFSRFANYGSEFKELNLFLKNKFNRNIYQMEYLEDEKI